ncbi:UNVERIFIED_CONTAM: hypothetical protein DES50_101730 [Williamsia faeni]
MPAIDSQPDGAPVWFDLSSSDPAAAAKFYGDLFGWGQYELPVEFGGYSYFTYEGKMVAGLGPKPPGEEIPDIWCTYFQTSDIEKSVTQVAAAGGSVLAGPMDIPLQGFMAFATDRAGAVFGLWQPREHRGFGIFMEPSAPCYFELQTTDYPAALEFYRDVLGNPVITVADTDDFRYSQLAQQDLEAGERHAGIVDASKDLPPEVPSHWSVYIGVESADATAAKATELGGTVVQAPEDTPHGRIATLGDPWGATIKLYQLKV